MSDKCYRQEGFFKVRPLQDSAASSSFQPTKKNRGKRSRKRREAGKKFLFRTLGKTGFKLPAINMGVMNSDNPNLVRAALKGGMILLDTAQTYQRGTNETMIGELLQGRPRDSYVIATKARLPVDQKTGIYPAEATEEAYSKKIDTSLKSLGLDHVDIYYHHNVWVRESALYEPIMKALEKAKKAGKTRFVGITTHKNEPEVIQAAIDSKFYDVVLTTHNFKQEHYVEVREAIAKAAGAGLGIVVMKAMGGVQLQERRETTHRSGSRPEMGAPGPQCSYHYCRVHDLRPDEC